MSSFAGISNLTVKFSNTAPDQPCEPYGDMFIDANGAVSYSGSKVSTIVIRGGRSNSQFTKSQIEDRMFRLTPGQRVSLMAALRKLASNNDRAKITSDNGMLQEICNSIYNNYCG